MKIQNSFLVILSGAARFELHSAEQMAFEWIQCLLLCIISPKLLHSLDLQDAYNFGSFVTYFCANEQSYSSATSTCDIKITRDVFVKTILLRAYDQPKLIKCNACDIGALSKRKSLLFSIDVMTVDLSYSHIEHIRRHGIAGTFKILVLAHNDIARLDEIKIFETTPKLTALDLSYNRIEEINARSFNGLPNLKTLWLCFNKIVSLHVRTFLNLPALRILKLHNNYLRSIGEDMFVNNAQLHELTIYNNSIEYADELVLDELKIGENYQTENEFDCLLGGRHGASRNFPEMRLINLSCSNFITFPAEHITGFQYKYLNLRHNQIDGLHGPMLFTNVSELNTIDLGHNQLVEIHEDAFNGIDKLEVLLMPYNRIRSLNRKMFSYLPNLLVLQLQNNHLQSIDTNLFWHNIKLKELILRNNNIQHIGDFVFHQLQKLDLLDVSNNSIQNEVLISVNAKSVNLDRSNAAYLYVGDRVQHLNAAENRISSVNIATARNLVTLNLARNNIAKMDLRTQENLRVVDLSDNLLTEMEFIWNAVITDVNLSKNFLVSVQFRTNSILLLEQLDLSNNYLNELHLKNATNLSGLNLSNNLFSHFPQLMTHNLKTLDISENQIEDFYYGTFQDFNNLNVLNLRNSGLAHIELGMFEHQNHLERLDISYNVLGTIDWHQWNRLGSTVELILDGNNLTDLNAKSALEYFPNLDVISISDNPWNCIKLQWIISFFTANYVNVLVDPGNNDSDNGTDHVNGISCENEFYEEELIVDNLSNFSERILLSSNAMWWLLLNFIAYLMWYPFL